MLLEQFDLLRNQSPQKRLDATLKIFEHLKLDTIPAAPVSNLETLKEHYGDDVHYAYTRLSRGLASNREAARLGFSACLSELLRALPLIDLSFVLASIERSTTPVGNVKGQETRDYQFGRLFGLQAIVTSGMLVRKETSKEQIRDLVGMLFELSLSKGWLRESCASVIIQVLDMMDATAANQGKAQGKLSKSLAKLPRKTAEMVHEMLESSHMEKTMEGLALHLTCTRLGSKKALGGTWKNDNLLASENLPAIASIMLEQSVTDKADAAEETDDVKATGTWKPKLHFAWVVLLKAIIRADASAETETITLARFWRQLVDEAMFSQSASHERKFHGLQLLPTALAMVPSGQVSDLFSANLLRTLINQMGQEDRYLHKAAKSTLQQIVAICEAQPSKAMSVVRQLMDTNQGTIMFDRLSKTKTCEQIMLAVPQDEFENLTTFLLELSRKPSLDGTETKDADRARQYLADILITLLKSPKTVKTDSWVLPILRFFISGGLFDASSSKKVLYLFEPALSSAIQDTYKARISIALGHLLPGKLNTEDSKELYAVQAIHEISTLVANKHYTLRLAPDEQILSLLQTALQHLNETTKAYKQAQSPGEQAQGLAFSLLYSLSILHIYLGEPDGVELLEDLEASYAPLNTLSAGNKSQSPALQTLVDLLLALLSKESAMLRKLVETVFSAFAREMQAEDLRLLLNVLEAQETGEGLFDKDEEEQDDDDEEGDDDEDDEMEDEEDAAESESEEEEEQDDNEQTEADRELDAALIAALGPAAQQKRKAEAIEDEDDSSNEELMDDDAMLKMDAHLENIFKRRKSATSAQAAKRQDAKQFKQSTIQLKSKVLDLLEIFIRENGSGVLVMLCVLPILNAAKSTSDVALADKARNLVKQKLTKLKTLPQLDEQGISEAWTTLQEVHRLAGLSPTPPFAAMASQCSTLLAKVLLHSAPNNAKATMRLLIDQYASSQAQWMSKKRSAYGAAFFTDFTNWCAQYRQK
ncbi:DNA polymerase V [Protomyces lactucae-debilis]|uniref:DNA polymerase V n=1 Tax=Protomyces lactucae-debilis TaxID=2754530 RepID=A0A1Y2EYI7_PROLT|nr:DNA polymerase V [Protomyces lactucae-debilis]ORY76630.1 DNA polymerase V [Protomyces lactucae-debilis]